MRPRMDRMAAALGIAHCRGITPSGFYCGRDHDVGEAERGMVHLAEPKRMSWVEVHRFLKLAASATDPSIDGDVEWRRIWRQNVEARRLARTIHVRIPRSYTEYDRAFVRASVIGLPAATPDRRQAFDWARR